MRDLGVWGGEGGQTRESHPVRSGGTPWQLENGELKLGRRPPHTHHHLHSSPPPPTIHPGAAVKEPDDRNWKRKTGGGGAEHVGNCFCISSR